MRLAKGDLNAPLLIPSDTSLHQPENGGSQIEIASSGCLSSMHHNRGISVTTIREALIQPTSAFLELNTF
ncbi:hypothetical protein [Nitrosomonas aestuarii]|uniref:hypothetical protein n=1 Tax=Nitrosomonas aestuarii TaxID=52441 RepID=UPI000D303F4B|nr:hypothetical protein [Nitrosomonas aestuarii]PTN10845.1 hypothetical protein C8R11_11723 [Nitrosomonas aestuarii]